jgi:hypothetical protein
MKHYTLGTIFLFFSLIIILTSYYYTNLTRPVEKEIEKIQLQINYLKKNIKINELEFAAHLNPEYLEKLEKVYFFEKYIEAENINIVGIKKFNFQDIDHVIKVKSN